MAPTPLHEFIAQLRRYDGKTDANEFILRFESDLVDNGYTHSWGIKNFDRILDGDAKSWFSSKWPIYSVRYAACQNDAQFTNLFNAIKADFLSIFDHSTQVATWRSKNKSLKYTMGDDAQTYVTSKMEILRHIDANMTENKRVHELIRGLPYDIQVPMVLQTVNTCDQFLGKLRKLSEAHFLTNPKANSSKSRNNFQSSPSIAQVNRPSQSNDRNYRRAADGRPICNYCKKVGHVMKKCWALAEKEKHKKGAEPQSANHNSRKHKGRNSNRRNQNQIGVINEVSNADSSQNCESDSSLQEN